jgi:hypothetical protein
MDSIIFPEEVQANKEQEAKNDLASRQLIEDFKKTFTTPWGQRIYKHLLARCHVFSTTFTGNSKTFFLEGERNIGLYLLAMREMASIEGLDNLKK